MKPWQLLMIAILVPGGLLIAAYELWRQRRAADEGTYMDQIKVLKPAVPMVLPAVKPLKAIRADTSARSNIERFRERMCAHG